MRYFCSSVRAWIQTPRSHMRATITCGLCQCQCRRRPHRVLCAPFSGQGLPEPSTRARGYGPYEKMQRDRLMNVLKIILKRLPSGRLPRSFTSRRSPARGASTSTHQIAPRTHRPSAGGCRCRQTRQSSPGDWRSTMAGHQREGCGGSLGLRLVEAEVMRIVEVIQFCHI